MSRAGRVGIVVVACGLVVACKSSSMMEAKTPSAARARTCDDVGAHASKLASQVSAAPRVHREAPSPLFGQAAPHNPQPEPDATPAPDEPTDTAADQAADPGRGARQACVDGHWSQAAIDCFTAALTRAGAVECVPAAPATVADGSAAEATSGTTAEPAAQKPAEDLQVTPFSFSWDDDKKPATDASSKSRIDCAALRSGIAAGGKLSADGGTPMKTAFSSIQGVKLQDTKYTTDYRSTLVIVRDHPGTIVWSKAADWIYYSVDVATEHQQPASAGFVADSEALAAEIAACLPGWTRELGEPKYESKYDPATDDIVYVRNGVTPTPPGEATFRHADDEYDKVCTRKGFLRSCRRHHPSVHVGILSASGESYLRLRIDVEEG